MADFFGAIITSGSNAEWLVTNDVIPLNQLIITTDGYIKIGDGTKTYAQLTAKFDPTTGVAISDATTTTRGLVRLATGAETASTTNDVNPVVPKFLDILLQGYHRLNRAAVATKSVFFNKNNNLSIVSGVVTPDLSNANVYNLALTQSVTLANPASLPGNGTCIIYARQDATGGRTITFGSMYSVVNGSLATGANVVNIIYLTIDATDNKIAVDIVQRS